jgi:hypothetical protein
MMMMYRKTALAVDDTWNGSSGAAVASLGHGPIAVEHQRLGGGFCLNHQRLKLNGFPVNTDFFESSLKGRDSELVEPVLTLLIQYPLQTRRHKLPNSTRSKLSFL